MDSTRSEGLDSLHDRIIQIHDALKDLRNKIPRIDGREPASDGALPDTSLSNSSHSLRPPSPSPSSLSVPLSGVQRAPLAAVDPEAEEQLCSDISDRLRDIRNDYDLLIEDAQGMGWFVPSDAPARRRRNDEDDNNDDDDDDADLIAAATRHSTNSRNPEAAVERARLAKALKRTEKAIASTRREFRTTRMNGLARKQQALCEKVFQELETYDDDSGDDESDDDDGESDASDDGAYDGASEKRHLAAPSDGASRTPSPSPQTAEASAAAELTAALRQTHARIVGEVARSDFAAQTLEESSRALAELGDRYSSSSTGAGDINSGLRAARSMVRGLLVAQKSDTWYLQMSLYILASTAAWLLFRRLLYGPLWLLVWWPVRSAFGTAVWVGKTGVSVGAGMGGAGGSAGSSAGSSIVSVPAADVRFSSAVPATANVHAEIHATESSSSSSASATSASSLVDEVGRIVDETATGTWSSEGEASTDAPNQRKRMWEEPVEAAKYEEQQRKEKEAEEAQKAKADAQGEGKGKGKETESDKKDEL